MIGTIKRSAESLFKIDLTNWAEYLGQAVMACRMTSHAATSFSRFRLLYGREATTLQELGITTSFTYETQVRPQRSTPSSFIGHLKKHKISQRSYKRRDDKRTSALKSALINTG